MPTPKRFHSRSLMVRFSPAERALLEALAAHKGLGMADALRSCLVLEAKAVVGRHRFRVPGEREKMLGQLAALIKTKTPKNQKDDE